MSGGGGRSGGTQVLKPEPWAGDIDVSYGKPSKNLIGLYGPIQQLYKQGAQTPYRGQRYPGMQQLERNMLTAISRHAPALTKAGRYSLDRGRHLANVPVSDKGAYDASITGLRGQVGSNFGLTNLGDWQGTIYDQSTGEINPYLGGLAGAAQNQAFRGFDRGLMASQGAQSQMLNEALGGYGRAAQGALGGFERSALGALGSYQRATQPVMSDLQETLATANRDFSEQVLPQIRGAAQGVGGYGGSRHGIAEGLAARGQIESLNRAIGRAGQGFGLGAAQLGQSLGLGAGQLGQGLALNAGQLGQQLAGSAQERGRQAWLSGQQAAETAADILPQMYGSAFENAQGRALQAAGLGMQGDIAGQNLGMQSKQMDIDTLSRLGQLGNQRLAMTGNIALGGLGAMQGGSQLLQNQVGMLGLGGELQRQMAQNRINAAMGQHYEPYQNRLGHLQNYVNLMSAARPPVAGAGTPVPVGTSRLGAGFGGALGGAGTGAMIGSMVPGIGTMAGALGGGILGGLGGLFG